MDEALRPIKGVMLVVLATFAFALCDILTKHLVTRYPVALVITARYAINLILITVVLWPQMGSRVWKVNCRWLVMLRGLCLALASFTMGLALSVMPVGETVAIIYLAPFFVLMLSSPVLGEKVGIAGWLGALTGFAGVLLILRPGGGLDSWGVSMALVNVGFGTAYHLLTRLLSRTESTAAMLWYTALIGTVCFGAGTVLSVAAQPITGQDCILLLALGGLATLGHFLFTAAYREATAELLAPVNYLHLFWAASLGWIVFGHMPDHIAIFGMTLVCISGAWSVVRRPT